MEATQILLQLLRTSHFYPNIGRKESHNLSANIMIHLKTTQIGGEKKTKKEQIREMNENVQRPLKGQEYLRECKDI